MADCPQVSLLPHDKQKANEPGSARNEVVLTWDLLEETPESNRCRDDQDPEKASPQVLGDFLWTRRDCLPQVHGQNRTRVQGDRFGPQVPLTATTVVGMPANVKQHRVPCVLLKRFATKLRGPIYVFDKQTLTGEWFPTVKQVGKEPYAYNMEKEIAEGTESIIDRSYKSLENKMEDVINLIVSGQETRGERFTTLIWFMSSLYVRTTKAEAWYESQMFADSMEAQRADPAKAFRELEEQKQKAPEELRQYFPTLEQLLNPVELPLSKDAKLVSGFASLPLFAANLFLRNWHAFVTLPGATPFICSDAPVSIDYAASDRAPGKIFGFNTHETIVQFPVANHALLVGGNKGMTFLPATEEERVLSYNGVTFEKAHRYVYASRSDFRFFFEDKAMTVDEYVQLIKKRGLAPAFALPSGGPEGSDTGRAS
jgi:hypothetical protein